MTSDDWNSLRSHKHKLTHVYEDAIRVLQEAGEKEEAEAMKKLEESGMRVPPVSKEKLIKLLQAKSSIHSQFQALRESCLYSDWNEATAKWSVFSEVGQNEQEAIAFFVLRETELQLDFLRFAIESIVNDLRKSGQQAANFPYPKYKDYRTPDQFESMKKFNEPVSKLDQVKYDRGLLVMKKFITFRFKSLDLVTFGVFRDSMMPYLKLIQNQEYDEWYPHPMTKALMLALSAAQDGSENGNYMGLSGDADTPEDMPHVSFAVVVSRNAENYIIAKVEDLVNDHTLTKAEFEKVIRTETIIERSLGKEVPVSTLIEAISAIGVKVKEIKPEELPSAIEYAKSVVRANRSNTPQDVVDEVMNIKSVDEWSSLSPLTRSFIVTVYGPSKHSDYSIFLTPYDGNIPKWKCRMLILQVIQTGYIRTA